MIVFFLEGKKCLCRISIPPVKRWTCLHSRGGIFHAWILVGLISVSQNPMDVLNLAGNKRKPLDLSICLKSSAGTIYNYFQIQLFLFPRVFPTGRRWKNLDKVWSCGSVVHKSAMALMERWRRMKEEKPNPIGSIYGIFAYMYHKNQLNVGKYTIHGSYGNACQFFVHPRSLTASFPLKN